MFTAGLLAGVFTALFVFAFAVVLAGVLDGVLAGVLVFAFGTTTFAGRAPLKSFGLSTTFCAILLTILASFIAIAAYA